jgi:PilZ domain
VSSLSLADLPDVNDLVDIMLDSRTEPLVAVIGAVTDQTLLLRESIDRTGRMVLPETGDLGLLVWGVGHTMRQIPIVVLETNRRPEPTWLVRLSGSWGRCQRRSFVRSAVNLPVLVRYTDTDLEVMAVDLSEGGVRCNSRSDVAFARGDSVIAEFDTGQHLAVSAKVVRLRRGDKERPTDVGLSFADLKMAEADDIRKFVFRQLHEQRRRGTA